MIEQLTIECENVDIDTNYMDREVTLTIGNARSSFIADLEPSDIVQYIENKDLLEEIGCEEVANWLMEKGSL